MALKFRRLAPNRLMQASLGWRAASVALVGAVLAVAGGAAPGRAGTHVSWSLTSAVAGNISTVAGGVGGPAKATRVALFPPCGVTSGNGNLYVADGGTVRTVNPRTDRLTTPAGTGSTGFLGDGGLAVSASLETCGLAVDGFGNLVIADYEDNRVRVVAKSSGTFYGQAMTAGDIYTVAGNGTRGYAGDGGPATGAELNSPADVAVDSAGNLVIADEGNDRVRVVAASSGTFYGQAMTAGDIYTIAGNGTDVLGDGGPATSAGLSPIDVAVDPAGNVVITDAANDRVRVVAESTGTFYGQAMTAGDIYTVAGDGTEGYSGDGGPATSAELYGPQGITFDTAGNLLVADFSNNRVRVVAETTGTFYGQAMTAGDIYTIAGDGPSGYSGDGGPATSAELHGPEGITFDTAGNLVIADSANDRVRVVAKSSGTFYGQAMTAGDIYTIAGTGVSGYSGDGGPATSAELSGPEGLTLDAAGSLVIADSANNRVRVVAARTGTFYGRSMTAGDIYTVAGDGRAGDSGNGCPATKARLNAPAAVALDPAGNLVIADQGNNQIRVVAESTGTFYGQAMTAGDIYTVAGTGKAGYSGNDGPATSARLSQPQGVAVDAAGNLVIADYDNNRIRVVATQTGTFYGQAMTAGDIYTVAGGGADGPGDGGPATKAQVILPSGVTFDSAGNLVIADVGDNRIRVVAESTGNFYGQAMTAGDIYTVAGDGNLGYSGDGGPALSAELSNPRSVAVDSAGNLVIADWGNARIRVVAESAGSFYGQTMAPGDIYTIAGNGSTGYAGDGGPATSAELWGPAYVAISTAGDLMIADYYNNRVRQVSSVG
jgi:trimeric autotransporter adhesin